MKNKLFLICILIIGSVPVVLAQSNSENNEDAEKNKKTEKVDNSTIQYELITNKKEHYLKQEQSGQDQTKAKNSKKQLQKKETKGIKNEKDDL